MSTAPHRSSAAPGRLPFEFSSSGLHAPRATAGSRLRDTPRGDTSTPEGGPGRLLQNRPSDASTVAPDQCKRPLDEAAASRG